MLFKKQVPIELRYNYTRDAIGGLLAGVMTGTINPFLYFIARDKLQASDNVISTIMAMGFLGMLLVVFYAHLTRTVKHTKAAFFALFIGRGSLLLMPLAVTPLLYTIIMGPMQVSGAMVAPAYAAIMTQIYPVNVRGKLMAYVRVGMAVVSLVVTQLSGFLLKREILDFRVLFIIGGIFGMASAAMIMTLKTDNATPIESQTNNKTGIEFLKSAANILRSDRDFVNYILGVFIFGFGNIWLYTKMPIFQVDVLKISEQQVALLANITTVVWMFSFAYWGKYIDIKSPVKAVVISILLTALIPVNYILTPNPWWLIPSAVVNGMAMAGIELSLFCSLLYLAKPELHSEYQSIYAFSGGIRGLSAPFFVPPLLAFARNHSINIRTLFGVDIVLLTVGAIVLWIALRKHLDRPAVSEPTG